MTFCYTDPDGDRLHVTPTTRFGKPAISLRNSRADIPEGAAVHIPLDRVEEVIAGIRDAARQDEREQLADIVRDLFDDSPCGSFDHHGYCQHHSWLSDKRCPHARAREVLAALDDASPRRGQPSIPHLIARAAAAAAQPGPLPFTCPVCRRTSHHPEDAKNGYCGNCHAFTGIPQGDDSV